MGKLKIVFLANGRNVLLDPYVMDKVGQAQLLRSKYNIQKMEEIDVEGDNYFINIDLNEVDQEINWDEYQFPNVSVKKKVVQIHELHAISNSLNKIINELERCRSWEKRSKIDRLGHDAMQIIKDVNEKLDLNGEKTYSLGMISHTLGKEVEMISYLKNRDSEKRKNNTVNEAIDRLIVDINMFKAHVDHYDLKNKNDAGKD